MKVWVLMGYIHYEGNYLIGVFSSEEKAKEAEQTHVKTKSGYFDGYRIEPRELDQIEYS